MSDRATSGQSPARGPALGDVAARGKWLVMAVASVGSLTSTLDGGMTAVSFPAVADSLATDTSTVLWINVAFWVTTVGLLLTLGWVGDVAGRSRVFTIGFLVFALGLALSAASANIWQLIGSRVVQGVGSAMLLSNVNALIAAAFPARERGKALGISGAVIGIGLSAGPLVGGLLLDALDWRALFYTRVPLTLLGAGLGWRFLPRDRPETTKLGMDYLGAAALFGTLATVLLVVNQGGRLGFGSPAVIALAVSAAIITPVLIWTQVHSARPILDFLLFKRRRYTMSLLIISTHYLAYGGIILVAPFFFIDALGFSASRMGVFIASFYILRTLLAPAAGRLSDKVGPRPFLVLGNLMLAAALLWLGLLGPETSQWSFLASLLIAGAGSAFFEPVVTSVIMGSVPSNRLGTASASIAMGRQTAFAVGVAVAGAIFTIRERSYLAAAGTSTDAAEVQATAQGFGDTMLAGAVLAAIAVALSFALGKERRGAGDSAPATPHR